MPLPDGPAGGALLLGLAPPAAVVDAGVFSAVLRRFRARSARTRVPGVRAPAIGAGGV
ncbi:hypothetical protein [Streptomyces mangrovi]|uniref:hypothetical protein n=1 Tax=Streptomyces mangrovi TaxID=1206892 RepID=UPI00399C8B52